MSDKRIIDYKNSTNPSLLDHVITFVFDNTDVYEYEEDFTYNKNDLVWVFNQDTNRYVIYRCNEDNITGPFDKTKWFELTFERRLTEKTQYTNKKPTLVDHGGILAGTTFDKVDYDTLITNILYPYIKPLVTNITPFNVVYEKGFVQSTQEIKFILQTKSHKITKLELYENDTLIETETYPGDGPKVYARNNIFEDKKYVLKITDENRMNEYNIVNVYFDHPNYYGICPYMEDPNEEGVKLASKRLVVPNEDLSYDVPKCEKQMIVFAIPEHWDNLKSIRDKQGLEYIDCFKLKTVPITCLNGELVNYKVYYSNDLSPDVDLHFDFIFQEV